LPVKSVHDDVIRENLRYLRDKGYVILFADLKGYALRPDLLAIRPKDRKLLWIEVVNVAGDKMPFREKDKEKQVRSLMCHLYGELIVLPSKHRELIGEEFLK